MAYDEDLAERIVAAVADRPGITTKKMFGGFGVMSNGNMVTGVHADELMARVGPEAHAASLELPGAHEWDFGGRTSVGMLLVEGVTVADDDALQEWLDRCFAFVDTLPPKAPKKPAAKKR